MSLAKGDGVPRGIPMRFAVTDADVPLPTLPAAPSGAPSVVAFSLPKAGSTLLYDLLQALAPRAGLAYVAPEDHFFRLGAPPFDRPLAARSLFLPRGYCYGGFRGLPYYEVPLPQETRTVVLVRDPRDMLVSLYYSVARSHVIPKAQDGATDAEHYMLRARAEAQRRTIDEFVVSRLNSFDRMFAPFFALGLLARPNVALYRYEDVIFRKREWVADMCGWFGWAIPREERDAAADRFDIRPERADPEAHIRQVAPGNHRTELAPQTVRRIENALGPWMRRLGYL